MIHFTRRFWLFWILLFASLTIALAQQRVEKIEIRHVGPAAASDDLIKANIRVKVGDTYTLTGVDDDVRSLWSTGLFRNIQVQPERTPSGGMNLVYIVQGHPILTDIRFEGNKQYTEKKLLKEVTSKIGQPLDERKLFTDAQAIQKKYQKAGYQKTTVRYLPPVIDANAGRGTATFEIKESPKVRIEKVEFEGAQAFPEKKLRKILKKTRRHWMFSWITGSGVLKDEEFEDDKEKLIVFYQNEGYIDFEIQEPVKFDYADPRHLTIRFKISEGKQYKVGAITFKGNSLFTSEQILKGDKNVKGPKMLVGEIFTPNKLEADVEAVRDFYGSKGYIDTWVRAIKNPNTETGTMDLVYEIHDESKGKSFVEKIEIKGNTRTRDKVVRRELAVAPGEVFDITRVKRSKGRLEQMGYFNKVETQTEPTDIPNRKNLVVDVEEATTGNVIFGAGFSTTFGLEGTVEWREGNFDLFNPPYFRGGGQKFRIGATLGTRRKDYQISFVEPWFLNRRLALGTDLFHRELNYYSDLYTLTETGARLSLRKALGSEFLIGTVSYTLENIGIHNVDSAAPKIIRDEPNDRLESKLGLSLAYDTRNDVRLANKGQRSEILTELAGGPLGAETDFYKFEARSSWYLKGFFEGHVWEVRGRAGVVDPYGSSDRVPLFDRFFLGGVNSLRGYRFQDVGPHRRDDVIGAKDEAVGGDTYWFGSVEYSLPIIERLRFALFYDIGNVYEDAYSFRLAQGQKAFNDNWGLGIHLNIPHLGPIRLEYGIPITHDQFSRGSGRFQFSVRYSADY